MPFLGQDWRSPGCVWVRTCSGWERLLRQDPSREFGETESFQRIDEQNQRNNEKHQTGETVDNIPTCGAHCEEPEEREILDGVSKLLEAAGDQPGDGDLLEGEVSKLLEVTGESTLGECYHWVYYSRDSTRECHGYLTLGEAVRKLDFSNAVEDTKRFRYVCKLLHLLLGEKMTELAGSAQKNLFSILEKIVNRVIESQTDIGPIHELLTMAAKSLWEERWHHIGYSKTLWIQRMEALLRMKGNLNNIRIKERSDDGKMTLTDLPNEVIREILHRVADHRDIFSLAASNRGMSEFGRDWKMWKNLCEFHFTEEQIKTFLKEDKENKDIPWQEIYLRCYRRFGPREVFTDMLQLCCSCKVLFWKDTGHPCLDPANAVSLPITPKDFLKLFEM
ncbi:F-box only protein 32-like isoform X1 [Branchiostoma floridae]|uniref:F-box only protein 32-like isoform X1 n=1 Tax=Branchiostoma floridae TaxID=7739 RepID=A0A9J7KHR8_BRAFL|nr:F-box only protein 32-like isoform X1 [Branchiostoma floridae]